MANTNDMNTPTKVPCGGFVAGAGLKVEDGKVSVNGGVETWIWCKMTPQTSDTSADLGYCYINEIRVTDADYNELWSFTPETPKKDAGLRECMDWLAENDRVKNLGFGCYSFNSYYRYEPWILAKFVDAKDNDRYIEGYEFVTPRPFAISGANSGFFQEEYRLYFAKPFSTMKWKYLSMGIKNYQFAAYTKSAK